MKEPTELAPNIWLDETTDTVVVGFDDRVTMHFCVQEFWEICDNIISARTALMNTPGFVVGEFTEEGEVRTQLFSVPDDDIEH